MTFEFATAGRILFGEGRVRETGDIAATLGTHALLVRGRGPLADPLAERLRAHPVAVTELRIAGEPTVARVEEGVALARGAGCDLVIAIGGGSVIDAGKAIAALLSNPGEVRAYLEVVGEGKPLEMKPLPFIAIPTTAGTGAEVTRNAVLGVPEKAVKVSLRSPLMLPAVALIDPVLTHTLSPQVTASTGLDALTQCIEPFVSPAATPLSDGIAREGMARVAGALRRAVRDGGDAAARREMAIASLCGGLALANARLGAVHGFAAPIGGMFPVPHGVVCARLLPGVVRANLRALRAREPGSVAHERYAAVARILTGSPSATPEDGADWLRDLVEELEIPRLSDFGLSAASVADIVPKAMRASSMQGNPVKLAEEELAEVLRGAL